MTRARADKLSYDMPHLLDGAVPETKVRDVRHDLNFAPSLGSERKRRETALLELTTDFKYNGSFLNQTRP